MNTEDVLPFTVLVAETPAVPIEVYDQSAALRMAVVDRSAAHLISGDEWDVPGVYVLLDRPNAEGDWEVHVGKAPAGVRARLQQHVKGKDHWYRAVLIRRDTTFGFNSAQIGWLEGRLYDLFVAAANAKLHNGVRPSDETLPPYDRQMLESVVLPVARSLRVLGHDPATPDDAALVGPKKTSRFYGITVPQLMGQGLLAAETEIVSTNGAWPASGRVLADGRIEMGGTVFETPSAAAAAVKGGAANGWDFWAVEGSTGRVTLATLRARYLEQTAGQK